MPWRVVRAQAVLVLRKRAKSRRPAAVLTWKQRVEAALDTVGKDAALEDIYAVIRRQKIPNRSKTWQATVRRTLQELKAEGKVGRDAPGQYHAPPLDLSTVSARLERVLNQGFTIVDRHYAITTPNKFQDFHMHLYEYANDYEAEILFALEPMETIKQATLALAKWYSSYTWVSIFVDVMDEDGEIVDRRWITLAFSGSPKVAAGQLVSKWKEYAAGGKYQITEDIARIGWRVREL